MSKLIQHVDGRLQYRCPKCSGAVQSISHTAALRVLHLYPLVLTRRWRAHGTPMRTKAMRLVVRAPPSNWGWGLELDPLPVRSEATPRKGEDEHGKYYEYTDEESEAMWCNSCPFQGRPTQ